MAGNPYPSPPGEVAQDRITDARSAPGAQALRPLRTLRSRRRITTEFTGLTNHNGRRLWQNLRPRTSIAENDLRGRGEAGRPKCSVLVPDVASEECGGEAKHHVPARLLREDFVN